MSSRHRLDDKCVDYLSKSDEWELEDGKGAVDLQIS